jgi:hypothetical protein
MPELGVPNIPQGYDVESCKHRLKTLIDNWPQQEMDIEDRPLPWSRRESIQGMFRYFWDRFCSSPAAKSHDRGHGAIPGGLLIHSTLIWDHMHALLQAWGRPDLSNSLSVPLLAFCHDFGKVGDLLHPNYIINDGPDSKYKPYKANTDTDYTKMSHDIRSLFCLQAFGVPLMIYEHQAIWYHSLGWNPDIESTNGQEHPLLIALGNSDLWVSRVYRI